MRVVLGLFAVGLLIVFFVNPFRAVDTRVKTEPFTAAKAENFIDFPMSGEMSKEAYDELVKGL